MGGNDDLTVALTPLIDLLDRLEVDWYVGGSVASTVHGRTESAICALPSEDLRVPPVLPLHPSHPFLLAPSRGSHVTSAAPTERPLQVSGSAA